MAELFSIIIAATALVVATTSRRFTNHHFAVFVAIGIGWCAALDVAHVVTYQGMNIIAVDSSNVTTQLWIVARSLQALTLLVAPIFLRRQMKVALTQLTFAALAIAGAAWVASGHFPNTFVAGEGLTPFKIIAEYVIIALMLGTALRLARSKAELSRSLYLSMQASLLTLAMAEFAFTQYVSLYGNADEIGHLLKIFGYWFIYQGFVQSTLRAPFAALSQTANSYNAVPDPVVVVGADGIISDANGAAVRSAGMDRRAIAGRHVHTLFHAADVDVAQCPVCGPLARDPSNLPATFERGVDLGTIECAIAPLWRDGERYAFVQVVRDISGHKTLLAQHDQAAKRVRRLNQLYNLLSATNRAIVRCDTERALLSEVFDALIAHGSFTMVMIVKVTENGAKLEVVHSHNVSQALHAVEEARVLAVADVLESMAAHRPYRPALGVDSALAELQRGRGLQYDEASVDAAHRLMVDKGFELPV